MNGLIYTMGIALMLTGLTEVQAIIPIKPDSNAPEYSKRIQPAAAVYYYDVSEAPYYYEYDIYGNLISGYRAASGYKDYSFRTWDNSKGYPILLDNYMLDDSGSKTYTQRTTLDASGVRTALYVSPYGDIPLDAAGHALSYGYDNHDKMTVNAAMTWDGDRLATFKYHYVYGSDMETDIDMTNIEIVYQTKPFNAFELVFYNMLDEPLESGIWINADGTGTWKMFGDTYSGALTIRTVISEDEKTFTKTVKIGDKLIRLDKMVLTDDNGSNTFYIKDENGIGIEWVYIRNVYGDLVQETKRFNQRDADAYLYEWEYDAAGRPLGVKKYLTSEYNDQKWLREKYVFTAWHDGSSITATSAVAPRILGGTLYRMDGTKVRTLTAEEAQSIETLTAPQHGIYLLMLQTDRGIETCKVAL